MMSKGIEFTKLKPIAQTENNMRLNSLLQQLKQIIGIETVVAIQVESTFNKNKSVSK